MMKRTTVLFFAALLPLIACDNSVEFSPTAPSFAPGPIGPRSLEISGSLTTETGSCLGATVLFDGRELADARTSCPNADGCVRLDLSAVTPSATGHHTISFEVVGQSARRARYVAEGTVLVDREGLTLTSVPLILGPKSARLRAGESITFDLDFSDFLAE